MANLTRRDAALLGLAAMTSIRTADAATTAAEPLSGSGREEPLSYVDPELRAFLRTLPPDTPITLTDIKQWRQSPESSAPVPDGVLVRHIPGSPGAPNVRIFIFGKSLGGRPRPGLLYMHGGGYISGSTASSWPGFAGLQKIATDHDCMVVSVDYRLAPETPFPGSLEDNYTALKWLHVNAESLGVDPAKIAVMGESAGGGQAATLTLAARDRGEIPILFQLLVYPMLDDRTGSTLRVPPHIGEFIWTRQHNRFGWSSLLGVPAGSKMVPKGSVPARASNLGGLPPTYIGVGSVDLFVEEDIEFAKRLIAAGVSTELHVAPGAYHGFFFLSPDATVSKEFAASFNAALARGFERT
jgi:acetyl esterase/lipase